MTPQRPPSLSPAEWNVMKIAWHLHKGAARDIYREAGAAHGMNPSTVKTLLRRLVEKGHLTTTRVGNCFVYQPTRSRVSTLCSAADRLLEHIDDGAGRVLAHMVKKTRMSAEEIAELRAVLDAQRPEAGEGAEDDLPPGPGGGGRR